MKVFTKDCEIVGQDPKEIRKLAKRLESVAREINELGLEIFGAEGSALYIIDPHSENPIGRASFGGGCEPYVLADIEQPGNGGQNQCKKMSDGTHALCG